MKIIDQKQLTIDPVADNGGSAISDTKLSFCVIDDREVTGDAFADVTGVTAELPFVLALAIAFLVASLTSWNFSINFPSSASLAKPRPKADHVSLYVNLVYKTSHLP